jgi:DNA-binding response OmpR family regulator
MAVKLGVLIVEDDRLVAEAIRDGVRVAGYEVCGLAATVDQAVALARINRPNLAIIDVDLGESTDGVELARRLTKIAPMAIMFMTGDPSRLKQVDVGHAWMAKPYRVLDLINALEVVHSVAEGKPVTSAMPFELHLINPPA